MSCNECGKPDPSVKPPPIRIAIDGFEAHEAMGEAPIKEPIDWFKVTRLPAFEMFIAQHYPHVGANMNGLVLTDELFNSYCTWHKNKGQWPSETPLGELIDA